MATTISFSKKEYKTQYLCTGSKRHWSDTIVKQALTSISNGDTEVTIEQWPSRLGKQTWREIVGDNVGMQSLGKNQILTLVILHEFMHSARITGRIGIHPLLIYYALSPNTNDNI